MNKRLAWALLAVLSGTGAMAQSPVGDAAAGETKAGLCAACHSVDGNSTDPQYPKIAGQHEHYIAHQLALYKSGERENAVMMGFSAGLSVQDMADLGAYFAKGAAKPDVVDPEQAVVGQQLYRGGDAKRGIPACMACHGPAGRGNPGPAYPALNGQHAEYTQLQLERFRDGMVNGDPGVNINAGVMADVSKNLNDADIAALSAYLKGLYAE
jgi:cytochrome c553